MYCVHETCKSLLHVRIVTVLLCHIRMSLSVSMETVLRSEGVQYTLQTLSTAVGWGRRTSFHPVPLLWYLYLTRDTSHLLNTGLSVCVYVCACVCVCMHACVCECTCVCEGG